MKKYRILWERVQLGNTMVNAKSIEEAREIAKDIEVNNQLTMNQDMTGKTKQPWHLVDAYCTEYKSV